MALGVHFREEVAQRDVGEIVTADKFFAFEESGFGELVEVF